MDSSAEKLTFTFGAGEDRVPTPYNRAASTFDGRQATTTFRLEATGTLGTTEVSPIIPSTESSLTIVRRWTIRTIEMYSRSLNATVLSGIRQSFSGNSCGSRSHFLICSYKFSHIQLTLRALTAATKVVRPFLNSESIVADEEHTHSPFERSRKG